MYEPFFALRDRPFTAAPAVDAYYPAEAIEIARKQLSRTIERGEGIGMVVGGPGTGKSMLLHRLGQEFAERFHVVLLAGAGLCTRRALLQSILFELKLPYRGMEEGELRLSLLDHLRPSRECPHGMVLLIDEAHTLPLRLLEELRLITNLSSGGELRVRMILAGTSQLDERFAAAKLAAFSQRIAARAYLQPMSAAESAEYIRFQIRRAGGDPVKLFTPDALRAVHHAADGIPRIVNQVCDHALFLAAAGAKRKIDAEGIQEAWSDLQQLPAPWQPAPASESMIEFGSLDDASDPAPVRNEMSTEATLDRIDDFLGDLTHEAAESEFRPAKKAAEVELSFRTASNERLFGTAFSEEEFVLDRYAALDASRLKSLPQVSTPLGRLFTVETTPAPIPQLRIAELPDTTDEITPPPQRVKPEVKPRPLAGAIAALKAKQSIPDAEPIASKVTAPQTIAAKPPVIASVFDPDEIDAPQADDPVYPEIAEERMFGGERREESHVPPPASKRVSQFGKLFASLRRGG